MGATALVVLLVQASAPQVIGLFADDPDAMAAGVLYLRACCSANSLAFAAMYALDSFAQATGAPRLAAVNALLDAVVVRVGLAALLVPALGYPGVLAAQALSPALPCVVGAAYLRRYARGARPDLCQDFGHGIERNHAAIGIASGLGSGRSKKASLGSVRSKKSAMASAGTL